LMIELFWVIETMNCLKIVTLSISFDEELIFLLTKEYTSKYKSYLYFIIFSRGFIDSMSDF